MILVEGKPYKRLAVLTTKKERDTFFNTKRNMHARLEAPEVDFAAPLAAFDHSHQRLWLVACHVLRQRQDIDA